MSKPLRMSGFIDDIDGPKRAEEALRQSNDELQSICEGMADGLLIADVETKRFLRANAAFCTMLGYSEKELVSMSVSDSRRYQVRGSITPKPCKNHHRRRYDPVLLWAITPRLPSLPR
jgi:PAS domain-containing protein